MVGKKRKTEKTKIKQIGRFGRYKARRAYRQIFVKTPGGRTVTQYKKRKPKQARCANCGAILKGIARERPYKMKNMPKIKKTVSRAYGGYLCSRCARKQIVKETRSEKK